MKNEITDIIGKTRLRLYCPTVKPSEKQHTDHKMDIEFESMKGPDIPDKPTCPVCDRSLIWRGKEEK